MKSIVMTFCMLLVSLTTWAETSMVIDVRTPAEYQDGHLDIANNIPYESVAHKLVKEGVSTDTKIYLYCRSGRRATFAKGFLEQEGYTNVVNLGGLGDAEAYFAENPLAAE